MGLPDGLPFALLPLHSSISFLPSSLDRYLFIDLFIDMEGVKIGTPSFPNKLSFSLSLSLSLSLTLSLSLVRSLRMCMA